MRCPKCRLINSETASRCECGYNFYSKAVKTSFKRPINNLASLGQRFLGQLIDSLVFFVIIIIVFIFSNISKESGGLIVIFGVLFAYSYLIFADGIKGGQSFGKKIMKIKVIDASTGIPCTFLKSLVRNLCTLVLGIFDCVSIFGDNRQRLGDKIANTLVVKISNK
jgi:uncharacterized RDD family membrane protein YckC